MLPPGNQLVSGVDGSLGMDARPVAESSRLCPRFRGELPVPVRGCGNRSSSGFPDRVAGERSGEEPEESVERPPPLPDEFCFFIQSSRACIELFGGSAGSPPSCPGTGREFLPGVEPPEPERSEEFDDSACCGDGRPAVPPGEVELPEFLLAAGFRSLPGRAGSKPGKRSSEVGTDGVGTDGVFGDRSAGFEPAPERSFDRGCRAAGSAPGVPESGEIPSGPSSESPICSAIRCRVERSAGDPVAGGLDFALRPLGRVCGAPEFRFSPVLWLSVDDSPPPGEVACWPGRVFLNGSGFNF
jgi:hypothetical protein